MENKNEKKDEIVNNENTTTEKKKTLKVKTAETFLFHRDFTFSFLVHAFL